MTGRCSLDSQNGECSHLMYINDYHKNHASEGNQRKNELAKTPKTK